MTLSDAAYGAWLLALLTAVAYVGSAPEERGALQPTAAAAAGTPDAVADATGRAVPRRAYARIASASSYADALLLTLADTDHAYGITRVDDVGGCTLAEPERIIALSQAGHSRRPDAYRYGSRALIASPSDLERLLTLRADLLLVNHLGAQSALARVRNAGIEVFDLGELRGLASLETGLPALAALLGERARGERLWQRFHAQLQAVARDIPPAQRRAALYLAIYAGKLYGGTRGTSYHDVLSAAGLIDSAPERYRDWPAYDPEEILRMDPALIVTETGMGEQLCQNAWLKTLQACRAQRAGIVELASQLLGDPGLRVYPNAAR